MDRGIVSVSPSPLCAPDAYPEVTNSLLAFIGVPISNPPFKPRVVASQLKPEDTLSSIRSSPRLSPADVSPLSLDNDDERYVQV